MAKSEHILVKISIAPGTSTRVDQSQLTLPCVQRSDK